MKYVFTFLFLAGCLMGSANPGDTTVVQTFTFEEQNNPNTAYDSPGRRWFTFPDDNTSYRKVLMYHKLKCFEDGGAGGLAFPCGEWDYLTYNYLFEHTGELDSTALQHPFYLLDNQDFESADLIETPRYNFLTLQYDALDIQAIANINDYQVGSADGDSPNVFKADETQHRYQAIYTAAELANAGLSAGDINRISFPVVSGGVMDFVRVKLGARTGFSFNGFDNGTFTTVFEGDLTLTPGNQTIDLTTAFNWDGVSDILVDISSLNSDLAQNILIDAESSLNQAIASGGSNESFMRFNWNDEIKVPASVFSTIDDAVTISFWLRGDANFQPENGTVFEGVNATNNRVLNSHLPWSNSRVYWDAGWDAGYDRIDKAATEADFEAEWNHWAFTKDNVTGDMKIYLNGVLWHSGTGFDNPMSGIVKFSIGAATSWSNFYRGDIDEFRIFNVALSEGEIASSLATDIDAAHPLYSQMVLNYTFDHPFGTEAIDLSASAANGTLAGSPQQKLYMPWELSNTYAMLNERAVLSFGHADYTASVVPSSANIPMLAEYSILTEWEVTTNDVDIVSATAYWLPGDVLYYYENGEVYDTVQDTNPTETFTNDVLDYFGAPFEVINRFELGRFITPYGIQLDLEDGWTWVFDVTDYEQLLHGEVELEAGNWQELLDLKFVFIEGTAPRDVKRIETLWRGSFGLSTFEEQVGVKTVDVLDGETMFRLKTRASGHGFGTGNNCAEFCFNQHKVKVNGTQQWAWEIMQECADNPLYPQGGTWIYDRAAWCPGAPVATQDLELTPFVSGDQFDVDYDITYDPYGNYVFEGQIVAYGDMNHQNDVELDWIISPSDWKINSRVNPICDEPVVRIENAGAQTLTSCVITYNAGGSDESMTWTGSLEPFQTEDVTLEISDPAFWSGSPDDVQLFTVSVSSPNGVADENEANNTGTSTFNRPPVYSYGTGPDDDNRLIIWTKTNNAPWETEVRIETLDGDVVFFRDDYSTANTNYRDTIQLNAGCYKAILSDSGEDGLSFFANNDGNGFCRFKKVAGANFIAFEPDFGKEIIHYFQFETGLTSVEEWVAEKPFLTVYPNPGNNEMMVKTGRWKNDLLWTLFDVNGQAVTAGSHRLNSGDFFSVNTRELAAGLYFLVVDDGETRGSSRWMKE